MKKKGIGQGMEGLEGDVREKTGEPVVTLASVATAGIHSGIQCFALK